MLALRRLSASPKGEKMTRASVVFLVLLAACASEEPPAFYGAGTAANPMSAGTPPPPMDRNRRVNKQDCAKPVDTAAGNLRCK
jgi:hypothetical protein